MQVSLRSARPCGARLEVLVSSSAAMYRRQSLHFVAAAPDRLMSPGRPWLRQTTPLHQQHGLIAQRGHALWPVVALVSAPHHRFGSLDVLHLQSVRTARLRYAQVRQSYIASAPQVSVSHDSTTLRRATGSAFGQQRSHASSPAHTRALRANGMATSATAFVLRRSAASVSWQGGVPPYQGPWCRLAGASCWHDSRGIRASCGTRPLRPPASFLHIVLFCEVAASRYAKAPLGVAHRWRALSGLQNPQYAKWPSLVLWLSWRRGISQALRADFWSVACGQSLPVCPRPPARATCELMSSCRLWRGVLSLVLARR